MEALTQILSVMPSASLGALLQYGIVITLVYLIVWRWLGKRLQRWRIQLKQRADYAQIRSEILNALLVFLVASFTNGLVVLLNTRGLTVTLSTAAVAECMIH